MSHTIYHNFDITGKLNKVYRSIVEPEHLMNWWPMHCSGKPEKDEVYNFFFGPEYDWYGQVVHIKQNESFYIKMTNADSDWDPTTFGFDLEEQNGRVRVRFYHSGWPTCNEHFKTASFCWAILLNGLKNYVEKGIVVPFEERA